MKKNSHGTRGFIIISVLLLGIYSLYPSWQVHRLSGDAKREFIKFNPKVASKSVNFGLDLAGGTNIVVELDKSNLKPDEAEDVQSRALEIIRNRVDQFGLSEPLIVPMGADRISADMAGVDAEQARALIGETAMLEFKLVVQEEDFVRVLNLIDEHLKRQTANLPDQEVGDTTVSDTVAGGALVKDTAAVAAAVDTVKDTLDLENLLAAGAVKDTVPVAENQENVDPAKLTDDLAEFKARPFSSMLQSFGGDLVVREADVERIRRILEQPAVAALIPRDMQFAWGRGYEVMENGDKMKKFFALRRRAELDGKYIADAQWHRMTDDLQSGQLAVNLKLKGMGPKKFAMITGNNIQRQLAIVLDDQVISAPRIQDRIADGNAQITGLADVAEAKQLSVVLRAGALPAPMKIIELRNVGATLGEENIRGGLISGFWGMILVVAFMLFYYRVAGAIANAAVIFNVILIGAVMSMFNATLTLPGIAGIILTMGMAVDANVIIYERIKEELEMGKSARAAVAAGYEKAFSTIFDSNITTFLTAFILYQIGTGPIKGFGLTLMIGILVSMFTALTFTRHIFDWLLSKDSDKISVGKGISWLNNPNLPVMAKRKVFIGITIALLAICVGSMVIRGFNVGIDFTGGHMITVRYEDDKSHAKNIRAALDDVGLTGAIVRTLHGTDDNQYLISLREDVEGKVPVREQVSKALTAKGEPFEIINEELVGPSIGKELRFDAFLAMFFSLIIIILYIWVRFGRNGLGFGVGAVVALVHDVIITMGFFSLTQIPLDATLVAAMLTIVGYSLNDTIVIFDRIRENTELLGKDTYESRVNLSVNQSFRRTIITAVTTLFVVVMLAWRGGASIQDFSLAMVIGIIVGTWSTIFVASPFVVWWAGRFALRR